jgi:predicted RNA-binding protein with TRAM domain
VQEGQVLDVKIDDISKHGDGVTHVDHFVVFVRNAFDNNLSSGQIVRVEILEVRARFAVAQVTN